MLWLSGLMGLLAVGAFTLLWFLPVRRKDEPDLDEASSDRMAEALAGATAGTEEGTEAPSLEAGEDHAGITLALDSPEDPGAGPHEIEDAAWHADETPADRDTIVLSLSAPDADGAREENVQDAAWETAEQDATDWFTADESAPDFEDFDPREDDLVVVWDDSRGLVPQVAVVRNEDDPAVARVILGDTILAQFRTKADESYDAVSLVPLSRARTLGWAHP